MSHVDVKDRQHQQQHNQQQQYSQQEPLQPGSNEDENAGAGFDQQHRHLRRHHVQISRGDRLGEGTSTGTSTGSNSNDYEEDQQRRPPGGLTAPEDNGRGPRLLDPTFLAGISKGNFPEGRRHTSNVRIDDEDDDDPLFRWMRERRKAFREFERSVLSPDSSSGFAGGSSFWDPGPPLGLFSGEPRRWSSSSIRSSPADSGGTPDRRRTLLAKTSRMLSSGGAKDGGGGGGDLSPKARVTYDEAKFQVEFDVQDFSPEDLSIKTEGDNVLVVLAKRETKSGSGNSYVSRQFEQRFTLPSGVRPEAITSSLSKSGVLTVTAPRTANKDLGKQRGSITGFAKTRGALEEQQQQQDADGGAVGDGVDGGGLPHPRVRYDEDKFQISLDCGKYKPEELDVKVEDRTIVVTAKQEAKEVGGGTRTRVFEQKFTLPAGFRPEKVTSSMDRTGVLTVTAPRTAAGGVSPSSSSAAAAARSTIEDRMDRVLSPSNWADDFGTASRRATSTSTTSTSTSTPAASREGKGLQQQQQQQQRSLFSHSEAMDNMDGLSQVVSDGNVYKILVNVINYKPEELTIKTVGHTVQVEAKHFEKTSDGHSYSSRNFTQSFSLPAGVNPEEVTSSLSKDGTLTISAPLPQPKPPAAALKGSERLVPIKHH